MKTQVFDDAAMIRDPGRWPCWPYLPVKRKDNSLENKNLGVICSEENHPKTIIIYHVYLFKLPSTAKEFRESPKTKYNSVEEMLADGWIVD